jgi:Asp-tRNA(Asn)/Glu-tRNA(Gln) amidotransferase A subunit family amidase
MTTRPRSTSISWAEELAALIRRGAVPVELLEATFARIDAVNLTLNAFIWMDAERAMTEARAQTERLARGDDLGPLGGLPFGVKELENAEGFLSTSGCAPSPSGGERDDVHVARPGGRRDPPGKTNSPEFVHLTPPTTSRTTRNPEPGAHRRSSGAAAAIAPAWWWSRPPRTAAADPHPCLLHRHPGLKPTSAPCRSPPARCSSGWTRAASGR